MYNSMVYTCPMHPEVTSTNSSDRCPKCGMALVQKENKIQVIAPEADTGLGKITWKSYVPLVVIISVLVVTAGLLAYRDGLMSGTGSLTNAVSYFMIGFFLTFGTFKLMDLKGFKEGYSTYDLLAQKVPAYGYVYPFIELFFGFAMIFLPFSRGLLVAEITVMAFSGLGVAVKLAKKEPFICACLGTFLKVPLTKVTLIEDFGMAALALVMLVVK